MLVDKYALMDEPRWVKLHITLPTVDLSLLSEGAARCEYRERSFDLRLPGRDGAGEPITHRLHVGVLAETVVPAECKLRLKPPHKLVVWLRKEKEDHSWHELVKIKGIGETGTILPDYGDTVVVAMP